MNSRRERLFRAPGFRWNPDRDHFLMEVVGKGGVVRQEFIERLVFPNSVNPRDLADDRLRKMEQAKLVRRIDVRGYPQPYWSLTATGVALARTLGVVGASDFESFRARARHDVAHLDYVNAFRFAVAREAGPRGCALSSFWPEVVLRSRLGRPTACLRVVPDSVGVLTLGSLDADVHQQVPFGVEIDLNTERHRVVVAKGASWVQALRENGIFGLMVQLVVFWLPAGRRFRSVAEGLSCLHRPRLFIVGELPVDVTRLELPPFAFAEDAAQGVRPSMSLFDLARTSPRTSPSAGEVRETESLVPQEKTQMEEPRELRSWSSR